MLFGGGFRLALLHTATHGSCHGTGGSSFSRVSGDSANGRAARRPASCTSGAPTGGTRSTIGGSFLLGGLLFGAQAGGRRSLGVNAGLLLSGTVAIALVLKLLVGVLAASAEYENAEILGR